jgi:spermidine synthase
MITLAKKNTAFGEITILKSRVKGSHIYCQGDWFQSEADSSGVSLVPYVHAIFGLLAQTHGQDILMIGCGGGTLGTMLAKAGRLVTIVDIDPQSIALARQYFSLPLDIACHAEDGWTFLERNDRLHDAIVVDAFTGETVPQHLCSTEFFRLVCKRLRPSGCVFLNVFVQHGSDLSTDVIAARMAHAEFKVRVLDSPGPSERNAIVMGGTVAGLRPPTLLERPEVMQDEIIARLDCMRFRGGRRSWNASASPEVAVNVSEAKTP